MGQGASAMHLRLGCALLMPLACSSPAFGISLDQDPTPRDTSSSPNVTAAENQSPSSQDLPPADVTETIVVTGSRIPRRNLTAASPVTIVKGEEVKLQGAILTEQLTNSLPQVVPDQGAFISNGASGTSTVDLRGLGAGRTLVLINGKRLLPGDPSVSAPDINAVPSFLIGRVEVLTGGASSVYGSDAIAGVVNFILDAQLEGLRIDGQASVFQHDNRNGADVPQALLRRGFPFPSGNTVDGGTQDINAAIGKSFADDLLHLTIYGGYRKLSDLTQDSRDYSACALTGRLNSNLLDCGGSPTAYPGNFFTVFGDVYQVTAERTFVPGISLFNYGPFNYYQRPGRRYTAGGFADLDLGPIAQLYFEVMFMDDRSIAQIAPSGNFQDTATINCDNPMLSEQQRNLICFNGNFVDQTPIFDDDGNLVAVDGDPIAFRNPVTGLTYFRGWLFPGRRNVEGGPRRHDIRHKNRRVLGGIKGELMPGVTYDASYLAGRVKMKSAFTNALSVTRIRRALDVITDPSTGEPICRSVLLNIDPDCVPWDIFAIGKVTKEATDYLTVSANRQGTTEQQVATAYSTIDLAEWGVRSPWTEEALAINLGAEYRKDSIDYEPDEILQSGDLAGQDVSESPFNGTTRIKELFVEARIPLISDRLIHRLTLEGGYRQSWHSNPENSFSSNSYKVAIDLSAVRGLRLRASHQRAVRAPNIQELFAPVQSGSFATDPCAGGSPIATREQCAQTGVTTAQYGHILAQPELFGGYNSINGGFSGLEAERARTRSVGMVLQPKFVSGFSATIDWFDILLDGAIEARGAQNIMNDCIATGDPLFCSRIHRDSNGSLWLSPAGFIDNRNANIGSLKVRGIDVGASYSKRLDRLGSVRGEFLGSWLNRLVIDPGGLSTSWDCAGLYGLRCGVPKPTWRHTARFTWTSTGNVSLSLNWRFYGKVTLDRSTPGFPNLTGPWSPVDEKIGAQSYFDLTALFDVANRFQFRLGARNIFDREPPIVTSSPSVPIGPCAAGGACNGNTYPQVYDPLGRYIFAGFTVEL